MIQLLVQEWVLKVSLEMEQALIWEYDCIQLWDTNPPAQVPPVYT